MSAGSAPAIAVCDLQRWYARRTVHAVRGVSFTIGRGEIFGLIGPDGAGKTSIIQMIAGVLAPHAGAVDVAGIDVVRQPEAVKTIVGYMPQGLGSNLYESLTVAENIEFFRDLRELPAAQYTDNRADLLRMTRLADFLDRRAADLSGGMRQKLALICALIHLPDVLLLDEPTTGVDPVSRQDFWRIISRVVQTRGATVLLSTSYMDEAERCQRIALLHDGVAIAAGAPAAIRELATGRYATITATPQTRAVTALRARDDVVAADVFGDEIRVHFDGELRAIESAVVAAGAAVDRSAIRDASLEDVFLQLVAPPVEHAPPPASPFRVVDAGASAAALVCRGVTRRFGRFTAVDGVDLAVARGEILGLLGPNGAGKTTLIKMMCGLLPPSAGTIVLHGQEVNHFRAGIWRQIGYMSQRFSLYRDLTVRQNVRLYADLYDVAPDRCAEVVARLGIEAWASQLVRDLPSGLRQRLSLACAVLHDPSVVFLDEPTSGVDPVARRLFWDLIYSLSRQSGVTVIVSTHYMDEAAHCDRLGLMDAGRLIAVDSPARLRDRATALAGEVLVIRAADPARVISLISQVVPRAVQYGAAIHVRTQTPSETSALLRSHLAANGAGPVHIEREPLSMDEMFVDFIQQAEGAHA